MFNIFGKTEAQRGKGRQRKQIFDGDASRRGREEAPEYIKIRDRKPHDFVARMAGPAITIVVTRRHPQQ